VDINQLYTDYKQAYNSINRYQLVEIMQDGVPIKLRRLFRVTVGKTNNKAKAGGKKYRIGCQSEAR